MTLQEIKKEYLGQVDPLDLDLILAHTLGKSREFVLAHPEFPVSGRQETIVRKLLKRRIKKEPLAYILGHKEFYGLEFEVDRSTLIPRPETELLVDLAESAITDDQSDRFIVIDVGTGSGNIIVSLAKKLNSRNRAYFATDISSEALRIARKNIRRHKLEKKIRIVRSDLLEYFFHHSYCISSVSSLLIVANLPYLSQKIYSETEETVKNFEPRSALLSSRQGLDHYERLLNQIKELQSRFMFHVSCFMEISPEQKTLLEKVINRFFPQAKIRFHKDLSRRWRVAQAEI